MSTQRAADQAVYDALYTIALELSPNVYTHAPPEGVPYPYIQIGSVQLTLQPTKSRLLGRSYSMISVWGSEKDRRAVSDLARQFFLKAGELLELPDGLQVDLDSGASSIDLRPDQTTNNRLWRALITLVHNIF
ncbi:MAG: hypothetical protein QM270_02075 [Bacillota bacterium]|nr:hypothetical protein [Bacillota bacterium]